MNNGLKSKLKGIHLKMEKPRVWEGPSDPGPNGGITQSLLGCFLTCRERFRLLVVEGLASAGGFSHRLEYGNMWHLCEENYLLAGNATTGSARGQPDWALKLKEYCQGLCKKYPEQAQQEQIQHWYSVCKTQFPIYVKYWAKHPDMKGRTPLVQEHVFHVPYELPNGEVVYLRGKDDSIDLEGKRDIILQENKTKADIDEPQMKRQLAFDAQTMIYVVALDEMIKDYRKNGSDGWNGLPEGPWDKASIAGVRYNVVRRPLSGGKGSIKQLQGNSKTPPETKEQYYARLGGIIADDPGYFFMRWKVALVQEDIERFKHEFLNPILTELCHWWHWVDSPAGREDPFLEPIHWRTPFGIYSPLLDGGSTELDEYLASGSKLGLEIPTSLFKELES